MTKKSRRLSVGFVEVVALVSVTTFVLSLFGSLYYRSEKSELLVEMRDSLTVNGDLLSNALALPVLSSDESQILKIIESAIQDPSIYSIQLLVGGMSFQLTRGKNGEIIKGEGDLSIPDLLTETRDVSLSSKFLGNSHLPPVRIF